MKKNSLITFTALIVLSFFSCKENETITSVEVTEPEYEGAELSLEFDQKIDSLIALMTLEEKVGMLHGNTLFTTAAVERLGIPKLQIADGPLGIREELEINSWTPLGLDDDFATYYPAGAGLSATWNTDLAYAFGNGVGEEARARNKDILLSPAINIIRTPLGGRTYEYFTEDPFLNKKMTVPFVKGIQKNNVAACVKHYAANNQETNRNIVDVQIDERTLREIYLPAYKAAVTEANAYSLMGAYNKFRGDYLCENDYMLNTVLRDEWDFKGIIVSDWAAVHSTVKSLKNGLDIEMGTPKPFDEFYLAQPLIDSAKTGKISDTEIDKHVKRILRLMYNLKMMEGQTNRVKGSISTEAHFKDAYNIAAESVVLLKNEQNLLPLQTNNIKSIAVIGDNATKKNSLGGFGAGVKTKREVTPLEGLQNRFPESVKINYAQGYLERYSKTFETQFGDVTVNKPETIDELDPKLLEEAVEAAKNSDVAVLFVGSNRDYESEASDRKDLELPFGQEALIEAVLAVNPNTVVVMIAGAPFDINEIKEQASTLVWSWFNGSEGGNALADVLLGNVNPSGRLPWTMPKKLEDSPAHATNSFPGNETLTYDEGILVGYRWFDTKNIEPLYPFGYGLSYTTFEFSNLKTDKPSYTENDMIQVSFSIKNTGNMDGKEVAQLYITDSESSVEKAAQELKGFKKVMVKSGSTVNVTILLPAKELAYYDVSKKDWVVEPGAYKLKIGKSSRDIVAETTVSIE
ncbi:glycoside hydrolase family 3 C-terminal domain-containing protein [Flavobacteriaceae bacterium XHP0103]|uniref:glycoside hydrolase family 3 C-terminal domain-containing protein n=1 Tax=Marixanthotalea marina TaxID=2844359 RepID=UPI002989EE50|nr:glycoside hydrolase family 3 C-terminal domain-containing protein [Marixanthotalea marina]MBU3821014.1 glycoside hydrolase family 3 C-terminal domain-containing protein [Marixanthotalea marina]